MRCIEKLSRVSFGFDDVIGVLASVEMSRNDSSEGFSVEQVIAGRQEVTSCGVESLAPKQEGVQAQLNPHAGVPLVVGELNVGNLNKKIKRVVTIFIPAVWHTN